MSSNLNIFSNRFIKKFYDYDNATKLIGCFMQDTKLLKSKSLTISTEDFQGDDVHTVIFTCIHNLRIDGFKKILLSDIENYLSKNNQIHYDKVFNGDFDLEEFMDITESESLMVNLIVYYESVKKQTLFREYLKSGVDITDIYNPHEIKPDMKRQQVERLSSLSPVDIIKEVERKTRRVKLFYNNSYVGSKKKAGVTNSYS